MSGFLNNLPPRSFADRTVPAREDGSPMWQVENDSDYETYVTWLSDYLHRVELSLTPDQRAWLDIKKYSPDKLIFECSEFAGYAVWHLEMLEMSFEDGVSYLEYQKISPDTPPEDVDESESEELSEAAFARLHREWTEMRAMGEEWSHADIPYRPLLNWALRQIPDRKTRRERLHRFFENYSENAGK